MDRLDLLTQAGEEFSARGLHVEKVDSKEEFIQNIRTIGVANNTGEDTITVVNIQKFSDESIVRKADYDVNVQRVYFLDEAHRSYNPKGSFLSNLMASDREAVMIALTGTPLIGKGYNTKDVFGEYIHKYKKYVAQMSSDELEKWYDEIYEMCLLAFLQIENADRKIQ